MDSRRHLETWSVLICSTSRLEPSEVHLAHNQTRTTGKQSPTDAQKPRIVQADKLNGGVVIAFDDGKTAFYPATLLHEIISRTQDLPDLPRDQE